MPGGALEAVRPGGRESRGRAGWDWRGEREALRCLAVPSTVTEATALDPPRILPQGSPPQRTLLGANPPLPAEPSGIKFRSQEPHKQRSRLHVDQRRKWRLSCRKFMEQHRGARKARRQLPSFDFTSWRTPEIKREQRGSAYSNLS